MVHSIQTTRRRSTLLFAGALAALILGMVALIWYTVDRLSRVEQTLARAEQRSQTVLRQMTEYSRELDMAVQSARQANLQAAQSQAARADAESRATRTAEDAEKARSDAQQAQHQAQQAQQQIAEIRRRREEELQRMQEALSRIAPTRRTPLGMIVELADDSFKFDFDKATIRPENRELLSRIAGVLLASKGYRLFVYGHTDDIGTQEYNQGLSERRATAVAEYLIKSGVPSDIITTKGYGKSSPRVKGSTSEARQRNRRVEIGIVDTIIDYGEAVATR